MKSFAFFAVLALVSAAAYGGVKPKSVLTDVIQNVIKNHRADLANLLISKIDLGEHGSVTDLTLTNLENFVLAALEAPGPLSFKISNLTVVIEWAGADAQYNFVDINIPELGGITINGQGKLSGRVEGGKLSVALDCKLQGITTLQIVDFHDLVVEVQKISQLVLEGQNEADVQAIADWIPGFIQANYQQVVEENKQAIIDKINEILATLT